MSATFEVYQSGEGQWRWRLLEGNGEIVAVGESHTTKGDALRAARGVQRLAATAVIDGEKEPAHYEARDTRGFRHE